MFPTAESWVWAYCLVYREWLPLNLPPVSSHVFCQFHQSGSWLIPPYTCLCYKTDNILLISWFQVRLKGHLEVASNLLAMKPRCKWCLSHGKFFCCLLENRILTRIVIQLDEVAATAELQNLWWRFLMESLWSFPPQNATHPPPFIHQQEQGRVASLASQCRGSCC